MESEREREGGDIPFSLFTTSLLITARGLSRCFCRARITVTSATSARAYCRESNSLNSSRKTLFDHSKGNSRALRNSWTLERKSSSRNVKLAKSLSAWGKVLWYSDTTIEFFSPVRGLTHRFANSLVEQNRVDEFPRPFKRYLPALTRTSVNSEPGTL